MEGTAGKSSAAAHSKTASGLAGQEQSAIDQPFLWAQPRVGSGRLTPVPAARPVAEGTRVRRAQCPSLAPGIQFCLSKA